MFGKVYRLRRMLCTPHVKKRPTSFLICNIISYLPAIIMTGKRPTNLQKVTSSLSDAHTCHRLTPSSALRVSYAVNSKSSVRRESLLDFCYLCNFQGCIFCWANLFSVLIWFVLTKMTNKVNRIGLFYRRNPRK